ncbi:protein Wnt-4-like [Glandiceps talaboti]
MQLTGYFAFIGGLLCLEAQIALGYSRLGSLDRILARKVRNTNSKVLVPFELEYYCNSLTWLGERQHELCRVHPDIIPNTEIGAKLALGECQHQFRQQRWNCPVQNATDIFDTRVMAVRSSETAFLHAVMSAGVAYSVTRACGEGELQECGCDNKYRPTGDESKWNWDGCNDDIRYGSYFATDFMDGDGDDGTTLMNNHNNEAGRQVIKNNMFTKCKCHGVSGSCSSKICWRTMPRFRDLGNVLMDKYFQAIRVKYAKKKKRLRHHAKKKGRIPVEELVFLEPSPDWCEPNKKLGSEGTHGRYCNKTSRDSDSCARMCCGRGYQIMERSVTESCNCRFHWCCVVTCETCTRDEELHICN